MLITTSCIAIFFNSLLVITCARRPRVRVKTTAQPRTEITKPPTPQYCPELQTNLENFAMESFFKILNKQYMNETHPKNSESCYDSLEKMLVDCSITPIMYDDDIPKQTGSHLVIKLKFDDPACILLEKILKFLDLQDFNKLYTNEKATLLALAFSQKGNPSIREWIALSYQDGKILSAKENAPCLREEKFSTVKYKNKPMVEYFPKKSE